MCVSLFSGRYVYNADDYSNAYIEYALQLLDNYDHIVHKRQSELKQTALNVTTTQNTTNATDSTTVAPKSDSSNKTDKKKPTLSVKSDIGTLSKQLEKNLGENGTGIRKNYTATTTVAPIALTVQPSKQDDHLIVPTIKNNNTTGDYGNEESEINIDKFSEDEDSSAFNETLKQHHINQTKTDPQTYYNSSFVVDSESADKYWVKLENNSNVKINGLLSNAYRRAATVKLSFDFPFYGHLVRNVTIATGGFLYMGQYVHSWLAATQYIAPLMANFDTGLSNDSLIKYLDNGTSFTVQWEKVYLQDKPTYGQFTFQTTIFNNGDIVFVYKNVPVLVENIRDDHHPVKVGLSDAYIIDQIVFSTRRKTIYEYHRVNFGKDEILNKTVIYLKALPTCLNSKDCYTCLTTTVENFKCTWCPSTNRCSNGFDRHRQDWLVNGCDIRQVTNESQCLQVNPLDDVNHNDERKSFYNTDKQLDDKNPAPTLNASGINQNATLNKSSNAVEQSVMLSNTVQASRISQNSRVYESENDVKMGASGIITILFLVGIIFGLGFWVFYAYRNPHTTSGQILIRSECKVFHLMPSSFMLLSSMSPKITKTLKPYIHQRAPKLLALKKNLRRSSANEGTCPQARYRPSIIVIESSSESVNSSESDVRIHNKTVIVIPDSDNSESEEAPTQNNQLSKSKFVTITDWVKNVNTEQFSSTKDKNVYNFDDVLTNLPEVDADNPLSNSNSSKSDSCDSLNKFNIDILNELYCDTWKNLRDEVMTRSTPRRKKDDVKLNQLSKTEVNPKICKDSLKTPASPWTKTIKGLCDPESSNENSKSANKPIHRLSFNSDEESSSTSSKCSNKKLYSNRDSLSDLSDESKNRAKTKSTTVKKNTAGTAKSKVTAKKNFGLKSTTKDVERRESLTLDRHVTDDCVWKITPIKEKHDSGTVKSFLASLSGTVKLSQCDPAARIFRGNFKGYKDELLKRLFKLYNDKVFDNKLPEDILFEWNDRMRGTAGFCYCRIVTRRTGIVERKARIVLSSKVIDSCDRLRDTLIHENPKICKDSLKTPASPWTKTIKGLCDPESSNENSKSANKPIHRLSFNSDEESSSTSSKCSNKKLYSNRDSLSDLSDESKNRAKTKPTTVKKNTAGTAKSKVTAKKNFGLKSTTKDVERRESLTLDRHVTDDCVWKITPIKEKHDSGTVKSFLASLSGTVKLSQCDPSARIFRGNFKGYKDELLKRLFKLYNDKVFDNKLPEDILFEWNDRMRGTAGFCYCRIVTRRTGIVERKARIVLSSKVIDSCDRLRDTLIHELCHAATWIINEVANGHGDFWKAWASKASRTFPELPPIKRCHDYVINTKYTYRCMDCGYSIGRHSKSLDVERKRCGYCYGKFEILLNKTTKDGETKAVPVTPKKAPSGFALFVKEHYAIYKTPQLNHGQVMKL
ncbi:hypothetical protein FQR65_LT03751 [Abscondita terminalis]|nr:hypothetical protein FQR65_LT03751 [Abscondita terminalis]